MKFSKSIVETPPEPRLALLCVYCERQADVMMQGTTMCMDCMKEKQRTGTI